MRQTVKTQYVQSSHPDDIGENLPINSNDITVSRTNNYKKSTKSKQPQQYSTHVTHVVTDVFHSHRHESRVRRTHEVCDGADFPLGATVVSLSEATVADAIRRDSIHHLRQASAPHGTYNQYRHATNLQSYHVSQGQASLQRIFNLGNGLTNFQFDPVN